jgi:hypothetical protein
MPQTCLHPKAPNGSNVERKIRGPAKVHLFDLTNIDNEDDGEEQ